MQTKPIEKKDYVCTNCKKSVLNLKSITTFCIGKFNGKNGVICSACFRKFEALGAMMEDSDESYHPINLALVKA